MTQEQMTQEVLSFLLVYGMKRFSMLYEGQEVTFSFSEDVDQDGFDFSVWSTVLKMGGVVASNFQRDLEDVFNEWGISMTHEWVNPSEGTSEYWIHFRVQSEMLLELAYHIMQD